MQWDGSLQLVRHVGDADSQTYAPQAVESAEQPPTPLQLPTPVAVSGEPPQEAEPHVALDPGNVHALAVVPSHVGPQLVPAPAPVHAPRVPWGMPSTVTHVPSFPVTSHASHFPPHALSQQSPSTQLPETHSREAPQAVPLGRSREKISADDVVDW